MSSRVVNALSRFRLKTAVGLYPEGDEVREVCVARTPLGIHRVETRVTVDPAESSPPLEEETIDTADTVGKLRAFFNRVRAATITVGVRVRSTRFASRVIDEGETWSGQGEEPSQSEKDILLNGGPRELSDAITLSLGSKKIRQTATVKKSFLEALRSRTDTQEHALACYEPEVWAAWRASLHYAPLSPKKGLHLRFIMGRKQGLAIVGTGKSPLAWQLLSWESEPEERTMTQAFRLLRLYAARQLGFDSIDHVSIQGWDEFSLSLDAISETIGVPVQEAKGPVYDGDFVALGLALGGLDPKAPRLNLARSVQPAPSLLAIFPWGEVGLVAAVFGCMLLVMLNCARDLEGRLSDLVQQEQRMTWARGVDTRKMKSEHDTLVREVAPLRKYLDRKLFFSRALTTAAGELPDKTWLVNFEGADYIWEKNPNKLLGEQFVIVRAGAPLVRRRTVPPQVDEMVRNMKGSSFFSELLPRVKLADVNWKREGKEGDYSLFTIACLPDK